MSVVKVSAEAPIVEGMVRAGTIFLLFVGGGIGLGVAVEIVKFGANAVLGFL